MSVSVAVGASVHFASAVGTGLAITAIGLAIIGLIALQRLRGRLESVAPGDIALALVLVSVSTSRVFSPQYSVWIVGVAAAASVDPRSRLRRVTIILVAMSALTAVLFPWLYGSLLETSWYAVVVQILRLTLLLACTATAVAVVLAPRSADRLPVIRGLARRR